jgi:hypothetical protein
MLIRSPRDFTPGPTQLNGGPGLGSYRSFVNSFAAFMLGAPQEVGRTYQTVTSTNRQTQVSGFLQDSYKVTSRLTLDLGLRYEFYSSVVPRYAGGASNYNPFTNSLLVAGYGNIGLDTGVNPQWLFDPRFGFAYRVGNKSVIRGGFAISGWTGRYGFTGGTLSSQFPVTYNVQVGTTGGYAVNGSLNSLPAVPFMPVPSNGIINPAPNQGFFFIPFNNPLSYVENYNLTYERELPGMLTLTAGYVGNVGRQLPFNQEMNAAAPGTGTAGLPLNVLFGRTASTTLRADGVNSNYNSLQVTASKRNSHGLTLTASYTYSKSLDVGSNQPSFIDNLNRGRQYGPSDFDQTHIFVLSHIYELPFGKGKPFLNNGGVAAAILSGWQINGILRLSSGLPFTITTDPTACNCPGNRNFANVVAPTQILGGIGPGQAWFTVSSFAAPAPNTFGNVGRNTVRGPGLKNYDFSLFRVFRIQERVIFELRGEAYNLSNTPHFSNPDAVVTDGNFGFISSTLSGAPNRQFQLAARLRF